ncbi:MAG: hypothetical protein MZW92_81475 [Comamonadaceae bacterium]|nr:hypothetical protein [Comamonadaceae bacterium]
MPTGEGARRRLCGGPCQRSNWRAAYREVLGVDLEPRLHRGGAMPCAATASCATSARTKARLGGPVLNAMRRSRHRPRAGSSFRQADACSLPAELLDFDAVLLANLLCRLPSPKVAARRRLGGPRGLVKPGGLLAIFSPYSWLEQFTPPEAWLGRSRAATASPALASAAGTGASFCGAEGFELLREADEAAGHPRARPEVSSTS